jgi:hypothetical protein
VINEEQSPTILYDPGPIIFFRRGAGRDIDAGVVAESDTSDENSMVRKGVTDEDSENLKN